MIRNQIATLLRTINCEKVSHQESSGHKKPNSNQSEMHIPYTVTSKGKHQQSRWRIPSHTGEKHTEWGLTCHRGEMLLSSNTSQQCKKSGGQIMCTAGLTLWHARRRQAVHSHWRENVCEETGQEGQRGKAYGDGSLGTWRLRHLFL